jgi:hypothetical protein
MLLSKNDQLPIVLLEAATQPLAFADLAVGLSPSVPQRGKREL